MSSLDIPAGFTLDIYDSVGSTSDVVRDMADAGCADGTAIRAREQTGGRGRHGRSWSSPPGNLYLSVLLRETVPAARLPELSFVAAVAMGEAISSVLADGAALRFKWPNDILLGGAKCVGLLLEAGSGQAGQAGRAETPWVIIGSGVNIASHPEGTPYPATHLSAEGFSSDVQSQDDPVALLAARYLQSLSSWRERWCRQGFAPIRAAWRAAAHRVGEDMTIRLGEQKLSGQFVDMDETGGLVIDIPGAGRKTVTAGEVVRS